MVDSRVKELSTNVLVTERFCLGCGEDISHRHRNTKRCPPCKNVFNREHQREYRRGYYRRPEIKERRRRQRQTPKYKESIRKYLKRSDVKEKRRKAALKYYRQPRVKEYMRKYSSEYRQRPEVKERKLVRLAAEREARALIKYFCIDCGIDISELGPRTKRCPTCKKIHAREYVRKYYRENPEYRKRQRARSKVQRQRSKMGD